MKPNYTTDKHVVLKWLSEEKVIKIDIDGWTTLSEEGALRHLLHDAGSVRTYRLGPPRCRIDGVSYEAPLKLEDVQRDQRYWYIDVYGDHNSFQYEPGYSAHVMMVKQGKVFYSKEAAHAVNSAIRDLLQNTKEQT